MRRRSGGVGRPPCTGAHNWPASRREFKLAKWRPNRYLRSARRTIALLSPPLFAAQLWRNAGREVAHRGGKQRAASSSISISAESMEQIAVRASGRHEPLNSALQQRGGERARTNERRFLSLAAADERAASQSNKSPLPSAIPFRRSKLQLCDRKIKRVEFSRRSDSSAGKVN